MVSSGKFSLKWSDFQQKVSQSFKNLRNESGLYDVTLVSDDHQPISAHKVILSSCSDFFKKIFQHNTHSHPMIYLDNLKVEDLNLMLDYIYHGEVQIYQDHLDKFLDLATKYKLEGLLPNQNEDEDILQYHDNDTPGFKPVISSSAHEERNLVTKTTEMINASTSEVDTKFDEIVVQEGKIFICTVCNKSMTHKVSMKRHIETHMTGLSYECDRCGKKFRSSNALNAHKSRVCSKSILF